MPTKLFIILFIPFFLCSQESWQRRNTSPKYEINDILISSSGEFFISLAKNPQVYVSSDGGISWNDVSDRSKLYDAFNDSKSLNKISDSIYLSLLGSANIYQYKNDKFSYYLRNNNNLNFILQDLDNNHFYFDWLSLYSVSDIWNKTSYKSIWRNPDNIIYDFYLYRKDTNFIATYNDTFKTVQVYKLNSIAKESNLYSKINAQLPRNSIEVSKFGNVFLKLTSRSLFVASFTNPNTYNEIFLNPNGQKPIIYHLGHTEDGFIYALTNIGIYFNDGVNIDQWFKPYFLNQNIPIPHNDDVVNQYYIQDSLTAIFNFGDDCDESKAFTFSPAYKEWKPVILDININDWKNLQKDQKGILYAFNPCTTFPALQYYSQSKDDGNSWDLMLVNGEYVYALTLNKNKEAVVFTKSQKIRVHNSNNDTWQEATNPFGKVSSVDFLNFYYSNSLVFLEAEARDKVGKHINIYFYSEDDGLTWTEFNAFNSQIAYQYNEYGFLVTENKWIVYSYGEFQSLFSIDKGKTWQPDPMFANCRNITGMILLPDSRILAACANNGDYGVFISNTNNELEKLNPYFNNKIYTIRFSDPAYLFGFFEKNSAPFFSKDFGKYIFELDKGMPPILTEQRVFSDALLDENHKAYITIENDGLYVINSNIFLSNKDQKEEDRNLIDINIWSRNMVIDVERVSNDQANLKYEIFNNLAQSIDHGKLLNKLNFISLHKLQTGIYYVNVVGSNGLVSTKKFIIL